MEGDLLRIRGRAGGHGEEELKKVRPEVVAVIVCEVPGDLSREVSNFSADILIWLILYTANYLPFQNLFLFFWKLQERNVKWTD